MFFAPYGCSWAKHSICKSLLVQSQIPGLVHTHPSIFGGKLFIYYLEWVDNTKFHTQLKLKAVQCLTLSFTQKRASLYPVLIRLPRSAVREGCYTASQYIHSTQLFSFNVFISMPVVTRRPSFLLARAKKPLSTPSRHVPHFGNPITAGQDMLRGLSISFAYSPHLPDIRSLSVDWPSSLRWFCLWKWPTLQYQFSQGQRGTEWELNARNSCLSSRILFYF